ncbi:MAG: crossover junction endodeoxyribonuclease RuvC [bacterium]
MITTILGIDPGTATTGYGVITSDQSDVQYETSGVIETPPEMDYPDRLKAIYDSVKQLSNSYEPDVAAVEEIFFNKNVKTAITVGQARGVILLSLSDYGREMSAEFELVEYNPSTIKKVLTGTGKADKRTVQRIVKQELRLSGIPQPNDAADGLAIALTYCFEDRFEDNLEYQ